MKLNKKGFTLVELLAVISVLAIVSVIVMYTSVNVIGSAKTKSYLASVSNVEKTANLYIIEENNNIIWKDSSIDMNLQYSCVTVKDLIENGYFKSDVLESMVSENRSLQEDDYIYIERNKDSKTITKNTLLIDDDSSYITSCNANNNTGRINFSITPRGWSKEKSVTINYELVKFNDVYSNYSYKYNFNSVSEKNNFLGRKVVKELKVNSNGELYAEIIDENGKIIVSRISVISKIDNLNPKVELLVSNGDKYMKTNIFSIKLYDNESGLKKGKYNVYYQWNLNELTCEDLKNSSSSNILEINVAKDGDIESKKSGLISNKTGMGKLYACVDKIIDVVGNETSDILMVSKMYLDNELPIISLGNYTGSNEVKNTVTIPIKVMDQYSGVNADSFTYDDIIVKVGEKNITTGIILNRVDDNNFSLVVNNKVDSGDIKIVINDDKVLDNVGNGNRKVELVTNINFKNTYMISYDANGGSGAPGNQEKYHGVDIVLSSTKPTRTGYTFLGWSTSSSATSAKYSAGGTFSDNKNTTLYAVWKSCYIPIFTYTGNYEIVDDNNNVISNPNNACVENWKIRFLTDGTLTITDLKSASSGVDIFIVGGGGGGGAGSRWVAISSRGGAGGGGGAAITVTKFPIAANTSYTLDIGAASSNTVFKKGTMAYYTALAGGSVSGTPYYVNNSGWTIPKASGGAGRLSTETSNYGAVSVVAKAGASSGGTGNYEFNGTSGYRYGAGGGTGSAGVSTSLGGYASGGGSGGSDGGGKGGSGCSFYNDGGWSTHGGYSGSVGKANTGSGGGGGGGSCGTDTSTYGSVGGGANGGSGIIIIRNTRY